MDIRLIFRNYHEDVITMGRRRRLSEPTVGVGFRPVGRSAWKIRWVIILRGHGERRKPRKVADATLPRKSSKESFGYPYRKPTQVGEEKILRCE